LRGGVGLLAQALVGKEFARHDKASSFARVVQFRNLARVDRVDDRLLDSDGERAAHLSEPWISRVPVAGDDEVDDLLLAPGQRAGRQAGPQVLTGLEQFRQPDIGMVRPADDAAGRLGGVVHARLFDVHVGAV
jgi:hypothetical protein